MKALRQCLNMYFNAKSPCRSELHVKYYLSKAIVLVNCPIILGLKLLISLFKEIF